jgi:gas vesicle protein
MRRFISFLAGASLGGIVGAAVALLMTPASGHDIQAQIKERAEYIQLEVNKAAVDRRAEMEKQLAALRAPHTDQSSG